MKRTVVAMIGIIGAIACASGPHWNNIVPGMSTAEVKKEMKGGPGKVDPYANNYAVWFYQGDAYCILFQDDKVVSKSHAESKGGLHLFGFGGSSEHQNAGCVPPSQERYEGKGEMERETVTPIGTLHQKE